MNFYREKNNIYVYAKEEASQQNAWKIFEYV